MPRSCRSWTGSIDVCTARILPTAARTLYNAGILSIARTLARYKQLPGVCYCPPPLTLSPPSPQPLPSLEHVQVEYKVPARGSGELVHSGRLQLHIGILGAVDEN